ncbi:MAG: FtsX-like permease family protein [Myxococcota bacterium]|nr:FtsX-like permease family protein [Myxococcota bacterium]
MLSVIRLAWRNVGRNPRRTGIVVTAVAVGLSGTLLSMSILSGMMFQIVDNAIKTDLGHLQIHAQGFNKDPEIGLLLENNGAPEIQAIQAEAGIQNWAPRIRGEGLVTSPSASVGVRVIGVDPEAEAQVSMVADSIVEGGYFDQKKRVVLGEGLARRLGAELGDKIVLSAQDLSGDMTGTALRVGGIFRTPSAELDRSTVFLELASAANLFAMGDGISEIVIVGRSRDAILGTQERLSAALPSREIQRWDELQPLLASILSVMDQMAAGLYLIIFVAMSFGIANVLLMAIYERIREIGILLAVGLSRTRLVAMVICESLFVTLLGLVAGFLLALLILYTLSGGIDMSLWAESLASFGMGTRIFPVLTLEDFTIPTTVALLTALLASAWPALRAVRLRPAEAVRHD